MCAAVTRTRDVYAFVASAKPGYLEPQLPLQTTDAPTLYRPRHGFGISLHLRSVVQEGGGGASGHRGAGPCVVKGPRSLTGGQYNFIAVFAQSVVEEKCLQSLSNSILLLGFSGSVFLVHRSQ